MSRPEYMGDFLAHVSNVIADRIARENAIRQPFLRRIVQEVTLRHGRRYFGQTQARKRPEGRAGWMVYPEPLPGTDLSDRQVWIVHRRYHWWKSEHRAQRRGMKRAGAWL